MDPEYRYYNCNIQCPKLKTNTFQADNLVIASYSPSGIKLLNGLIPFGTVLTISPDALLESNACGELSVYLKNIGTSVVAVMMITVTKSNGVITKVNPYQTVGNLTSSAVDIGSDQKSVKITISPGAKGSWLWRGI